MKKNYFPIILLCIFLISCQTNESINDSALTDVENSESSSSTSQNEEQIQEDETAVTVENLPQWCKELPQSDFAVYACGIGNSSNLNISNSRALLDAKTKLASVINNEVSSRMSDFLEDIGNNEGEQIIQASEIVLKSVTRETQIVGYKELKSEFQSIGSKYQTYVLLEYPIGEANRILFNRIKEDETLSQQEAADTALQELEAEIDKKRLEN